MIIKLLDRPSIQLPDDSKIVVDKGVIIVGKAGSNLSHFQNVYVMLDLNKIVSIHNENNVEQIDSGNLVLKEN